MTQPCTYSYETDYSVISNLIQSHMYSLSLQKYTVSSIKTSDKIPAKLCTPYILVLKILVILVLIKEIKIILGCLLSTQT